LAYIKGSFKAVKIG